MSKTKTGQYLVPWTETGSLMHYATHSYANNSAVWKDNEPFKAALTLDGVRSGRSAKYVVWRDGKNRSYPMFVVDLLDLLERGCVLYGQAVVPGPVQSDQPTPLRWVVRKRGQNYGIALAPWTGEPDG